MIFRSQRAAIGIVFAVHGAVTGTFATRIPAISENLHLTAGALGLALLVPSIGALALMSFTGRIIHRLGGRTATHILLALWCLALIPVALASSLPLLYAALFIYGATAGMADIAMNAQGVELEQRMGTSIISSLHGLWSVGGFVAAGIGALAAEANVDVRPHFITMAVVLLVIGQIGCRFLAPTTPAESDDPKPPAFALPRGVILTIALVAFCAVFVEVAGSDWAAVYLRRVLDAGHASAALGYAVFAFTMAVCRLFGDRFIRRLGAVRIVAVTASVGAVGAVLIVLAIDPALTMVGFGMMGVGVSVVVPLAFAAAGRVGAAQGSTGHAIAGVATIAYGSGLAAPGAIGGIASLTSLRVSFILVAVLVTVVAVCARTLAPGTPTADEPVGQAAGFGD